LDWFFSRVIAIGRLAIGLELLATIGIGFLLDRINRTVERIVESVFFRSRRLAEKHLLRAASALPYATDETAIVDSLLQIPVDALDLAAAALYRRSDGGDRYEGVGTALQTTVAPPGFDRNDLLVRMLLADESMVWLDEVRSHLDAQNAAIYTLAIPVSVRHELVSFTLYGAHTNGAQLDPDEVELLKELAREAARAYDHVEAERARERYSQIRANETAQTVATL
jgi:GAF domain-containing protein